jgi:hypothetical protein
MSKMNIAIEADTYFTVLGILRERQKITPDTRAAAAMVDLHSAALREVDREIDAISEPPRTPAFHRRQAG